MEEIIQDWNYDDFLNFLLVHCAHADMQVTESEKEIIIKESSAEKYASLVSMYEKNTDFENMLIIHEFKDRYLTDEDKIAEVFQKVEDLFFVDGEYTLDEKNLHIALRMILG